MTVLIQREALSCPLYEKMSSHLGSYVEFRRCPLIWISAFWAMHIYQATESLAFHRVIALLRTSRDPDQKTCAFSSICTAPSRGKSHVVFLDLKVSTVSELNSPLLSVVHWSSRIQNKHTIFRVSGTFTREWNVVVFGLEITYFLAKFHATFLKKSSCSEVSLGGWSTKSSGHGFRSRGSPFFFFFW